MNANRSGPGFPDRRRLAGAGLLLALGLTLGPVLGPVPGPVPGPPSVGGGLARAPQPDRAVRAGGGSTLAEAPAAEPLPVSAPLPGVWREDELMLRLAPEVDPARALARHGLTLRRPVGPSGLAVARVPAGASLPGLLDALAADPRVQEVQRVGWIQGASDDAVPALDHLQWHLQHIGLGDEAPDLSGYVVAVLDTGVAMDFGAGGAAEGLASVPFVAPYDFVNGDDVPYDDHLHGTHVASLIASSGAVRGVAEGVTLMPLKVLDAQNRGSEADLVDALHFAVDEGARVVNLSLNFAPGYSPSAALQEALERAHEAGLILVGAAGNRGDALPLYPAASPLVLSVGGSALRASGNQLARSDTSSYGGTLDLLAPGGDLSQDVDDDGLLDGLLAEGPPAADGQPRYFLYAGTSQAAALVSGAVVHLLDAGLSTPDELAAALQGSHASGRLSQSAQRAGEGAGDLDLSRCLANLSSSAEAPYAMVLPYLEDLGRGMVRPVALVRVVDAPGQPLAGAEVMITAMGAAPPELLRCSTDAEGACEVHLDPLTLADGDTPGWVFSVDGVVTGDRLVRPRRGLFVTGAFVNLVEALDLAGHLDDAALALSWEAGEDDGLGSLAGGLTLLDLGVGAAVRPMGVLLSEGLVDALSEAEDFEVDLDGTGLITEPMGVVTLSRRTLDGSGLITEPMGFTGFTLLALSGTGLITEPMGFHALDLLNLSGSGLVTEPMGFTFELLRLDAGRFATVDLSGSALDDALLGGGLRAGSGELLPEWFSSSGALGDPVEFEGTERAGLAVTARTPTPPPARASGPRQPARAGSSKETGPR